MVYSCKYHVVWCPKYRRKVLVNGVDVRLKTLIEEVCNEYHIDIIEMEIMPDHIHLFIKATPSDSIAHIVSQLKGYTSYILRSEFPHLKQRVPTLWTRSYYVETIGHISEKTILKYIEDQKKK